MFHLRRRLDSNQRITGLQSAPLDHLGTSPKKKRLWVLQGYWSAWFYLYLILTLFQYSHPYQWCANYSLNCLSFGWKTGYDPATSWTTIRRSTKWATITILNTLTLNGRTIIFRSWERSFTLCWVFLLVAGAGFEPAKSYYSKSFNVCQPFWKLVLKEGLEPSSLAALVPKTSVSTNSTTWAYCGPCRARTCDLLIMSQLL